MKLTKRQWKDRERVLAWLNDKEFKENAKAEPAVPDLCLGEILEFYVPPDVTGAGQYFTPAEMSLHLVGYMSIDWTDDSVRFLDPCAGIGHLLWAVNAHEGRFDCVAYELEEECVKIGQKLFPQVEWNWEIPFDHVEKLENQFDFVLMNPPFGTRRGTAPGQTMSEGRCTKSEHVFFELAVRACKPGGQIGVIAPYNFNTRLPKALKKWLEGKVEMGYELGQLPGEFAYSGIKVHGFIYEKLEDPTTEWVKEVNEKAAELDDLCSATHPAVWDQDPDVVKKKGEYRELAAAQPEGARQLSLW